MPSQILIAQFSLDRSQQLLGLLNESDMYIVQDSRGCSKLVNQRSNLLIIDRIR